MSFVLYKYKGHLFWRISKIFAFIKTCIAFPFLIVLVTFFIRSRQKRNFATTAIIYTRYILVLANSRVFFSSNIGKIFCNLFDFIKTFTTPISILIRFVKLLFCKKKMCWYFPKQWIMERQFCFFEFINNSFSSWCRKTWALFSLTYIRIKIIAYFHWLPKGNNNDFHIFPDLHTVFG